jgi:guanylate kinase
LATHRPRGPRTALIPPKISSKLQRRIIEAKEHLAASEQELQAALSELKVEERADKRMISQRLERAFEKLAAGRRHLDEVLVEED